MKVKILTQNGQGLAGFHGRIGAPTKMRDSFGNKLFVGDVVIASNQDAFEKKNKYLGDEYGIDFVCEENIKSAEWTGKNQQYVMGLADHWNSDAFENNAIDFSGDYWDGLQAIMYGWIIHKIKDFDTLAVGERIGFLYVDEVEGVIDDE